MKVGRGRSETPDGSALDVRAATLTLTVEGGGSPNLRLVSGSLVLPLPLCDSSRQIRSHPVRTDAGTDGLPPFFFFFFSVELGKKRHGTFQKLGGGVKKKKKTLHR